MNNIVAPVADARFRPLPKVQRGAAFTMVNLFKCVGWLLTFALLFSMTPEIAVAKAHKKGREAKQEMTVAEPPEPPEVSLQDVLVQAEKASPRVESRKAYETAARANIGVAKADYLPTVDFQAMDSFGFPGSSNYLDMGGLVGSPFRSGVAGGFVLRQQIYDFGRTEAGIEQAKTEVATQTQRTQFEAQRSREFALHVYTNCSEQKSQARFYKNLVQETTVVANEVKKFVATGQRTIVDRYLAEAQVEEAQTSEAEAEARLAEAKKGLALVMGGSAPTVNCPLVSASPAWTIASSLEQTPYVATAIAELRSEEANREVIRAEYRPRIDLLGSAGLMERARLVDKSPYAVGVGLTVPLFNGFKEDYQLERSAALVDGRQLEVNARKFEISQANARYDELIAAATTRLVHLRGEQALAEKAVTVAKQRYFDSQGSLTDLREAIRNLSRTSSDAIKALAASFEATSARALANAGSISSAR